MLTLLLSVLAASAAAQSLVCASGSEDVSGTCAATFDAAVCTPATPINEETAQAPYLREGDVGGAGALTLQVRHGLTATRVVTGVRLSDNAACNYPGPNWSKGVGAAGEPCVDTYSSDIVWATAYDERDGADQFATGCGMARSEDADYVYFEGAANVTMVEEIVVERVGAVNRTIVSRLRYRIAFVKRAEISTDVRIFADERLLAAVTRQEWRQETADADFRLLTSLQAPFKVQSWEIIASPPGITSTLESATTPFSDCDQAGGADCAQTWRAFVAPDSSTCNLNGVYQVVLTLACQDGVAPADCPIDAADDNTVRVDVTLESEDVCAVVEEVIGVDLTLTPHRLFAPSTFTFGPVQSAFFQDQVMHYSLVCDTQQGFALASSAIESITITDAVGGLVTLYDGAAWTGGWSGAHSAKSPQAPTSHAHQFEFVADAAVYGLVPEDSSVLSTTTVVLGVVFANTGARKRVVAESVDGGRSFALVTDVRKRQAALDGESIEASTLVGMQPTAKDDVDDDGEKADGGEGGDVFPVDLPVLLGVAGAATLCCAMLVLFVLVARRRSHEHREQPALPVATPPTRRSHGSRGNSRRPSVHGGVLSSSGRMSRGRSSLANSRKLAHSGRSALYA